MTVTITKQGDGVCGLDVKRCYLPFTIASVCPGCGETVEKDLSSDYLSYPAIGAPVSVGFYHCEERLDEKSGEYVEVCGADWRVTVRLDLTITVVGDEDKP